MKRLFCLILTFLFFSLEVNSFGLTWKEFSSRYRSVIRNIKEMRQAPHQQFIFEVEQAKEFLNYEKSFFSFFFLKIFFIDRFLCRINDDLCCSFIQ